MICLMISFSICKYVHPFLLFFRVLALHWLCFVAYQHNSLIWHGHTYTISKNSKIQCFHWARSSARFSGGKVFFWIILPSAVSMLITPHSVKKLLFFFFLLQSHEGKCHGRDIETARGSVSIWITTYNQRWSWCSQVHQTFSQWSAEESRGAPADGFCCRRGDAAFLVDLTLVSAPYFNTN